MGDLDRQLLQQLYKKGLIHLEVPIRPDDHVSIPPLEVNSWHVYKLSDQVLSL